MSQIEHELRVLDINVEYFMDLLKLLGAQLKSVGLQRRYVYDFKPVDPDRWIRLRTNGKKTTLTFKQQGEATVSGTREMEIVVSDFEETDAMLNVLGYKARGRQENFRARFELNGVEVDIDVWPSIPPLLEVEGQSDAEVFDTLRLLEIAEDRATGLGIKNVYEEVYGIPGADKDLAFTAEEREFVEGIEEYANTMYTQESSFKDEGKCGTIR